MDDSDTAREESGDRDVDQGGSRDSGEGGDLEGVQDAAEERRRERTDRVEDTLAEVRTDLGNQKYPVSSEELSATYADQPIDLPNETESIGSVFQRIEDRFEDEQAAFDALITELDADERLGDRADVRGEEPATWSEERAETQHEFEEVRDSPIDEEDYESTVVRSRERAREAQAESNDEE